MAPLKKTERERIGYQYVCMHAYLIAPAPLTFHWELLLWIITGPKNGSLCLYQYSLKYWKSRSLQDLTMKHLKCHFKPFLISLHEIHSLTLAYIVIHTWNRIIHEGVLDYAVRTWDKTLHAWFTCNTENHITGLD